MEKNFEERYVPVTKPIANYYVQTALGTVVNNKYNEGRVDMLNNHVPYKMVVMTESEADEFVDKLKLFRARKVKIR